jgi:hypothetical protein
VSGHKSFKHYEYETHTEKHPVDTSISVRQRMWKPIDDQIAKMGHLSTVPCGVGVPYRRVGNTLLRNWKSRAVEIATIVPVLALSHQTGVTLAEVGFLLILFAGVWLVAAQIPAFKMPVARMIVAGTALALAGVLLIIATHWGHFG